MPTQPQQPSPRPEAAGEAYDPYKRRGSPQRPEDTTTDGDALNDTGEDNQCCKDDG